jgi:hypothetical protein
MRNLEKLSVSPWSIHAEGDFSVKVAAVVILVGAVGFALGQLSVIRACLGF